MEEAAKDYLDYLLESTDCLRFQVQTNILIYSNILGFEQTR